MLFIDSKVEVGINRDNQRIDCDNKLKISENRRTEAMIRVLDILSNESGSRRGSRDGHADDRTWTLLSVQGSATPSLPHHDPLARAALPSQF